MSKKPVSSSPAVIPPGSLPALKGGGMSIDRSLFDSAVGEVFAGLNIVKIPVGGAAGPFKFLRLLEPRILNKKFKKKIETGVAVLVNEAGTALGADVQLPASASMTQKLLDAKIAPGDVFFIGRDADYTSKQGREDCQAYILKVVHRSGEPAVKSQIAKKSED